ncbi:MAG TPA: hypothetical protein VGN57_02835 [Pirellulaceae bacterium]|jgi:hypothetical protein|nr:hypothetical protein [Pirellulaceae bacterium]
MNLDPAAIDRIVQEVLRRLASLDLSQASTAALNGNAGTNGKSEKESGETLRLTERMIAWRSLEDRLVGVKTIEVLPNAVVTPLVRDLLKERRIRLEVVRPGASTSKATQSAASSTTRSTAGEATVLWVGCDRETFEAHPHHVRGLVKDVEQEFLAEKSLLDQGFSALSQLFAAKPQGRTLRLWFTDRVAEAVCQANRHAHVRATWANDPQEAARNVAALRPNVLILPPARFSSWQVRQVVAAWTATPALA